MSLQPSQPATLNPRLDRLLAGNDIIYSEIPQRLGLHMYSTTTSIQDKCTLLRFVCFQITHLDNVTQAVPRLGTRRDTTPYDPTNARSS